MRESGRRFVFLLLSLCMLAVAPVATRPLYAQAAPAAAGAAAGAAAQPGEVTNLAPAAEFDMSSQSIFTRSLQGGWIVFVCLLVLVSMSVMTWAVVVAKYLYLTRIQKTGDAFNKSFWDSRSLNDLNGRLADYPYSPVREVFRTGYAELVRGSQLRDQASTTELAVSAALDNLHRALNKAKLFEKRRMEKFMSVLAISASACPFIGLFGTVWGIMGSFEGIARTGSASLAAVAPGISEALISTAFGLAAAIPAVIGYNIFAAKVRGLTATIDGFAADFLNIVERYLVTDKPKSGGHGPAGGPQSSQLADRL
jgi:biopolymer transport protein TolQ